LKTVEKRIPNRKMLKLYREMIERTEVLEICRSNFFSKTANFKKDEQRIKKKHKTLKNVQANF